MATEQELREPPPHGLQHDMHNALRHYGPAQVLRALALQMPKAESIANTDKAREAFRVTIEILDAPVQRAWEAWLDVPDDEPVAGEPDTKPE